MKIKSIISEIKKFQTIIIHRHVRPDPDAYGSQAALKEIIKHSFPDKNVYITGEEDASLHFLVRMDEVTDAMYENALVIVCDTANKERICDQRYSLGKKLIKIDHHPEVDSYGDIEWVDSSASSTCEMIYEFFLVAQDHGFEMTKEAARLIYAGIVGDTGRFLFPSTTPKTFRYAADLVSYNFSREKLYEGIYQVKENIARLRGYVLQRFKVSKGGVSVVKLTKEVLDEYQVTPLESGQLVGILGDVDNIRVWAFFIEEAPNVIRIRFRSKGPVINEIAAKYNGGGHPLAAGATVHSWDEVELVIQDLFNLCDHS